MAKSKTELPPIQSFDSDLCYIFCFQIISPIFAELWKEEEEQVSPKFYP
jgi:hypothetical protein